MCDGEQDTRRIEVGLLRCAPRARFPFFFLFPDTDAAASAVLGDSTG